MSQTGLKQKSDFREDPYILIKVESSPVTISVFRAGADPMRN